MYNAEDITEHCFFRSSPGRMVFHPPQGIATLASIGKGWIPPFQPKRKFFRCPWKSRLISFPDVFSIGNTLHGD